MYSQLEFPLFKLGIGPEFNSIFGNGWGGGFLFGARSGCSEDGHTLVFNINKVDCHSLIIY